MGALDRIVSAGHRPDESARGRNASNDVAADASKASPVGDATAAAPVDDAANETPDALPHPVSQRDAGELERRFVADRSARADNDRNGERAPRADRALDERPEVEARSTARREPSPRMPDPPSASRGLAPRLDDTPKPKTAASAPVPARAADRVPAPQPRTVEIRREQVVRERVVERTFVDRLVVPQPAPTASEPRPPLPSIVQAPERAESETKREPPPREDRRPRDEGPLPRLAAPPTSQTTPAPRSDGEQPERRREPGPRPHAPPRDATRDIARPAPTDRGVEGKRAGDRHDERAAGDRGDGAKTPAPRVAPGRALAALITPRPPKPAAVSAQPPKRAPAPRTAETRERQEPRATPRPPAVPRIQISIGRVEVRGKSEPAVQRGPIAAPRSHQIDPGLGFGPLDGGRV